MQYSANDIYKIRLLVGIILWLEVDIPVTHYFTISTQY